MMKEEEFRKILKIDFPEVNGDEEKTLAICKARKDEYRKRIIRLAYVLSSFAILICFVILSVVLINNSMYSDVSRINKSIDSLEQIDSDEEKMLRIMEIEKEIKNIPSNKKAKIDISKLSYETNTTVNILKGSVEWSNMLNSEIPYYSFTEIIGDAKIKELYATKGLTSNVKIQIVREEFIESLTSYFCLPYIDIVGNSETFYEEYSDLLNGSSEDYCHFQAVFCENINEIVFDIYVYGSGYIFLTKSVKDDDSEIIKNTFISLIPLDYSDFKLSYGAYSVTSEFSFYEICSYDSISSIDVMNSSYWFLLGTPNTYIEADQLYNYYNEKLKSLMIIEDGEMVKSIENELGNDYAGININLKENDIIAIFISKETNRFIVTHGIMTYAGVGTIEIE